MKKDIFIFIRHIKDAIESIDHFVSGVSKEEFMKNEEKQYAVIRAIEIIGEAAKNISSDFRKEHSIIAWKEIAGMRDRLIHQYFGVNLERIWIVIEKDLPELKIQIVSILKSEEKSKH